MKCRVCGYETGPDRAYCPMCGSKMQEKRAEKDIEMSWNTYDFPKPKTPEDIDMRWPSMNPKTEVSVSAMKKDGTEGFVSSKSSEKLPEEGDGRRSASDPEVSTFKPAAQAQPGKDEPGKDELRPQTQPAPNFGQGSWSLPQMQPEPVWTPYGVQLPPQAPVQAPAFTPLYIPAQYPAQPAWTIPPQPQQGQIYIAQPQPVYIAPQQVYPVYPVYPQQNAASSGGQDAVPSTEEKPAPEAAKEPSREPDPKQEAHGGRFLDEDTNDRVIKEHIVASSDSICEEAKKSETNIFESDGPGEDGRFPERFFTFNKKNEEFQKLLNEEYERIRALRGDVQPDLSRTSVYRKDLGTPAAQVPAQGSASKDGTEFSEFEKMLLSGTRDPGDGETLAINSEHIKGARGFSAEDIIEPLTISLEDTQPVSGAPSASDTRSEHRKRIDAMAAAREAYFSSLMAITGEMSPVTDNEAEAQRLAVLREDARQEAREELREAARMEAGKSGARAEAERLLAEQARLREIEGSGSDTAKAEEAGTSERRETEKTGAEPFELRETETPGAEPVKSGDAGKAASERDELKEAEEKVAAIARALAEKEEADRVKHASSAPSPSSEAEGTDPGFKTEDLHLDADNGAYRAAARAEGPEARQNTKETAFDDILDAAEEQKQMSRRKKKKHIFLKFLLVCAAAALLMEGAAIGLRAYAPDSEASAIASGMEQRVIGFFRGGAEKVKSLFAGDEQEQDPAPGEGPKFVLSDIAAEVNRNIAAVEENLSLGYDSTKTYSVEGLSSSALADDVAEKTEVVKTLIAYNSAWIDYVNSGDKACLDYLKADGTAYRSAVSFDKVGQISEKFIKLEIGEVRKNADTFFVFASEKIEVTQDGASAESDGKLIYELVKLGDSYRIKAYYNIN